MYSTHNFVIGVRTTTLHDNEIFGTRRLRNFIFDLCLARIYNIYDIFAHAHKLLVMHTHTEKKRKTEELRNHMIFFSTRLNVLRIRHTEKAITYTHNAYGIKFTPWVVYCTENNISTQLCTRPVNGGRCPLAATVSIDRSAGVTVPSTALVKRERPERDHHRLSLFDDG